MARQRQRKVVVGDYGFDLAAEDLDFDYGWLSSTIWMKMVAAMPTDEVKWTKWVHYAPVEIPGGSGVPWGGGGVMGAWCW